MALQAGVVRQPRRLPKFFPLSDFQEDACISESHSYAEDE